VQQALLLLSAFAALLNIPLASAQNGTCHVFTNALDPGICGGNYGDYPVSYDACLSPSAKIEEVGTTKDQVFSEMT
jgi:hypothetical protein